MKKFCAVLLSVLLMLSTGLNAMAAPLITSVEAIAGNWVVKGTWSGKTPLTIEVLTQTKSDGTPIDIDWDYVDSAGDIDGNILDYLAYFNQCDNETGTFEFKISAARLSNDPKIRIYADNASFYYDIKVLRDINAESDGTAFAALITGNAYLNGEINAIFDGHPNFNDDEKSKFWNKLFTYKENKTGGFANFGEIVTAAKEIAILSRVMLSDSAALNANLELLTSYGIKKSNSWNIYTKQGDFAKEDYLTADHKAILIASLKTKAAELNYANDFIQYFKNRVVLTACHNNNSDYLVRDIIGKSDVLAAAGIGKFSSLTAQQKLEIATAVNDTDSEFSSVSALAAKVSDLANGFGSETTGTQLPGVTVTPSGGNSSYNVSTTPSVGTIPQESKSEFTDIASHKWAEAAIYALRDKGIVNGTSDTTFEPEREVKREEFVKMLVLAVGVMKDNVNVPFKDALDGAWYTPYIAAAYSAKLVNGITDDAFGVGTCITREQLAVMIYRAIASKGALQNVSTTDAFTDINLVNDYALEAVNYVNAAGIMNGMGDGSFVPRAQVTRAQAAKVIYELIQRL